MKIDKDLIGGSTTLMLLSLLSEKDMYGYEIIRQLEDKSDNTFQFKEGTLYPVLHKLENKGLIKSYKAVSENNRERKYYHITVKGEEELSRQKDNWRIFSKSLNKVIGGELHAFA